jgi:uncharacterized protein (TIGR01244 family)
MQRQGRIVIACYRPKAGKLEALHALAATHHLRLYEQGLVTRRAPIVMGARDGTLLEVFEWKSQRAIDEAHHNSAVLQMWNEYAPVCDYIPVGQLAEAAELFSGFSALPIEVQRSPFAKVRNHVQVDAKLATSGMVTSDDLSRIAAAGYTHVVNLLPDDSQHALSGEAATVKKLGLRYTHIPVAFDAPQRAELKAFEKALGDGANKTWVHCAANMRVTAFTALCGVRTRGWSEDRARELIGEVWTPDATWKTFLAEHGLP